MRNYDLRFTNYDLRPFLAIFLQFTIYEKWPKFRNKFVNNYVQETNLVIAFLLGGKCAYVISLCLHFAAKLRVKCLSCLLFLLFEKGGI